MFTAELLHSLPWYISLTLLFAMTILVDHPYIGSCNDNIGVMAIKISLAIKRIKNRCSLDPSSQLKGTLQHKVLYINGTGKSCPECFSGQVFVSSQQQMWNS